MKCGRNVKALISVLIIIFLISASACSGRSKPAEILAPAPVPTDKVTVSVSSFDPPSALVTIGTEVTWTNRDGVSYLIAENGQRFAFNLPAGGSFSITFTDPGTYDYHCSGQPAMQGTITVVPGVAVQMGISGERSLESNAPYPPPGVSEVIAKVRPSVVSVSTEQVAGSGWILDKDGLIVTNNHVVEGAKTVTVTLENGQTFPAKTILTDAIDDLAVIDIGISDLSAATIGDSSKMRVGDLVMAMGNARGEGICTTQGAICSTGLAFTVGTRETLYNTLGTTAPITYGNSGGPLVNMDGEVIGIVTAAELTWAGTQVAGYAISSDTAQQVIRDLTQRGYVPRAWLGIKVSNVTDLPTRGWKLPVEKGAFVIQVDAQSPAGQAGLKAGDVIVTFGERNISTVDDLVTAVRATEIGQQVKTTYWRDNNENTVTANLVQDPAH